MLKKMVPLLIIVLVALTLIIFAAVILWNYLDRGPSSPSPKESVQNVEQKALSAKEISDLTVKIEDVTTNLASGNIVRISFAFELNNKKAKEEFSLLDFKVQGIIIQTLADMNAEDIQGSRGFDNLNAVLMNRINSILTEGKITQIDITNFILPG